LSWVTFISEKLARAVMAQEEFALVGNESVPNNETPYVIVDGGATTTLTSSFVGHQTKEGQY
jgi:hypothetical protein